MELGRKGETDEDGDGEDTQTGDLRSQGGFGLFRDLPGTSLVLSRHVMIFRTECGQVHLGKNHELLSTSLSCSLDLAAEVRFARQPRSLGLRQ